MTDKSYELLEQFVEDHKDFFVVNTIGNIELLIDAIIKVEKDNENKDSNE